MAQKLAEFVIELSEKRIRKTGTKYGINCHRQEIG